MKQVENLNQLIDQRKTILSDLSNLSEKPSGVGIRLSNGSITFIPSNDCDFSDIVKSLTSKVQAEIDSLTGQLPAAQTADDNRDAELLKVQAPIDALIDQNKLVQAKIALGSLIADYPELQTKLTSINEAIELSTPKTINV